MKNHTSSTLCKHRLILAVIALYLTLPAWAGQSVHPLTHVRDSLKRELNAGCKGEARLALLANLCDVSMSLNNDYSYNEKLWDEALKQQHTDYTLMIGTSLVLNMLNDARLEDADRWLKLCYRHFSGPRRRPYLSYLQLMRDVRDMGDQKKMARRLIRERVQLKGNADPYKRMDVLFKLGVIALSSHFANEGIKMLSWDAYLKEGYEIARKLPIEDAYSYQHQYLLALSLTSVSYTKAFLALLDRHKQLPLFKNRRWMSHRSELIACSRLMLNYKELSEEETERWWNRFCTLLNQYPCDGQWPYCIYYYNNAMYRHQHRGEWAQVAACCDTVIKYSRAYKFDPIYHFEARSEALGKLGKWKEAYESSLQWTAAKDSAAQTANAEKLMELETQYGVDKLTFENKMHKLGLALAGIVTLALLLLLGFLMLHIRSIRRKNRELVAQIQGREAAEEHTEMLQKEIPLDKLNTQLQLYRRIQELLEDKSLFTTSKLSREDVAEMLGTNTRYLIEAVREGSGLTFSDYINSKRVKYGRLLIEQNPAMYLDEISEKCGFSSRSWFNTTFKKYYHITPGDFRKVLKS